MQKIFFVFLFSAGTLFLQAQNSDVFSVHFNGKILLKNKKIPETNPLLCTVKRNSLLSENFITFTIVSKEKTPDWHRVIIIYDNENIEIAREIQKTSTGIFKLKLPVPAGFKKGTYKFESMLEPNDARQAALVRLRTFPLCNLTIQ
jgi:RNA polymerase subunit RPABC4/transcription elongation factor Spt4